jgi:hypothetical protein
MQPVAQELLIRLTIEKGVLMAEFSVFDVAAKIVVQMPIGIYLFWAQLLI